MIKPTVFVVDDNVNISQSLCCLVETSLNLPVIVYNDPCTFLEEYDPSLVGCILLDVFMPGMDGMEVLEELKKRGNKMPIIILTAHGDIPMAVKAIHAGAKDFIAKPFGSSELIEKISHILDNYIKQQAIQKKYLALFSRLTRREKEVMKEIVSGKLNKQIADKLGIKLKTVELHRFNIMHKLHVRRVAELINFNQLLA